jgi:hypothetical protein
MAELLVAITFTSPALEITLTRDIGVGAGQDEVGRLGARTAEREGQRSRRWPRRRTAAIVIALMVAASVAVIEIPPTVEVTLVSAFAMNASTRVPISLWASDTPIENAMAPRARERACQRTPRPRKP